MENKATKTPTVPVPSSKRSHPSRRAPSSQIVTEMLVVLESRPLGNSTPDVAHFDDLGDQMVKDLFRFEQSPSQLPWSLLLKNAVGILWESIVIAATMVGTHLINTIAIVLLNRYGSAREQAAVGLAIAYNLWFFEAIVIAMFDKFGIDWSRSFGAKQYHLTKVYFNQGMIVLVCTFAATTLPAYLFSEQILLNVGTLPELAASTAVVLKTLAIADGIESVSKTIKIFCMAQGQEQVFGQTAVISFITAVASAYWFIAVKQSGAVGWAYCKIVYESVNLLVCVFVLVFMTHPDTWGVAKLESVRTGLSQYFVDSFKYALGSYTECLGYMVSNYFVILTHDENQIAAFTIVESIAAVFYALGEAFATIMRTRMNILIGKKLNRTAKNFAMFVFSVLLTFCLVLLSSMYILRARIIDLYTDHSPPLKHVFSNLMVLFSLFGSPIDMIKLSGGAAMKTIGQIQQLVALNTLMYIGGNAGTCLIFYLIGLMNSSVAYSIVTLISWVVFAICIHQSWIADWDKIELNREDSVENEPFFDKIGTNSDRIAP